MKIQSLLLASLIPLCAHAQTPPAGQSPQAAIEQKAEALSQDQIEQAHDIGALSKLAEVYNGQGDIKRLTWVFHRLTELLPNSGDLKLQLALAYAKQDDKSNAYDTLLHMQVQGFGYEIGDDPRFAPIHGTKVWDYLVANLAVNSKPFGEGKAAFDLPKGDFLYDALAWDAKRKKLLVGSAREGKIQLADEHGQLADFISADANNGLWEVDSLAVDETHGKLYVASSASPLFKGFSAENAGRAGVFEFELASGKFLKKYILPRNDGAHILSRIVAAKDGNVYAADGARRAVYKLEGGALKQIVSNPRLTGITGLALSGDGKTLYIADYALGIFGYDLTKSAAFDLAHDPGALVLGGIDSLYWYEGHLVLVEGGMVPKRVMRLKLSDDGRSVTTAMPLDVANAEFGALGQAAVAGDNLYFIANRQEDLYDNHGVLTAADKLEPTSIFRSNLRYAWGENGVSAGKNVMAIGNGTPLGPVKPSAPKTPPEKPKKP